MAMKSPRSPRRPVLALPTALACTAVTLFLLSRLVAGHFAT
ncbi:MAG: hypothetical protein ACOYEV_11500 [Candidatus Nanopelagicales bacterium]